MQPPQAASCWRRSWPAQRRRRRLSRRCRPTPTPRDWSGQEPLQYPDPDIVALDNRFRRYIVGNTPIRRLHTGTLWAEGPAWNGVGRYLVWSDIPNNVQMRWIEDDGRVTVFRNPSGYSNGNTFDYEGRQLSCEHGGRRVVRYEPQRHGDRHRRQVRGQAAELAQRRRRASGRRHLVHRSELRHPRQLRRLQGRIRRPRKRSTASIRRRGRSTRSPTRSVSRTASASRPTTRSSTSPTPARRATSRCGTSTARRCATASDSSQLDMPGTGAPSAADGIRCDVDGNIWAGARPGRPGDRAGRRPHRHDPPAGDLRQRLLRRHAAQPAVHDRPASRCTRSTSRRQARTSPSGSQLVRCR